jgi:hypothetical protein
MVYLDAISTFPARYLGEPPTPVELDWRKIWNRRNDLYLTPVKFGELAHPFFYKDAVIGPDIIGIETCEYKYFHAIDRI